MLQREIGLRETVQHELQRLAEELEEKVEERTVLLQETNRFLEALVHQAPLAIVVLDLNLRVRVWSPATESLFGWSAEEVVGRQVPYISAQQLEEWKDIFQAKVREGKPVSYYVQRRRRDGTQIDVSVWAAPLVSDGGVPFAYLLIYADDRERKAAEAALRRSEERFSLFMDHLPGYAFIKDSHGHYVYMNKGCRDFYEQNGIKTYFNRTDEELWPPEVAEHFRQSDRQVLADGHPLQTVESFALGDEPARHVLMSKFVIEDDGGDGRLLCGVGTDISTRVQAEKELAELQSRQEAILDTIPHCAWFKDVQGRYIKINNAMASLLNSGQSDIEGKSDFDLWPQEQASAIRQKDLEVISSGCSQIFEELLVVSDGSLRWFETAKSPFCNEKGAIIGTTGIARDITERKEAERTLQTYQEQLSELADRLALAEERERRRIASELHDQVGQTLAFAKMKLDELATVVSREKKPLVSELAEALELSISDVRSLTFQLSPPVLYELGFSAALDWLGDWLKEKHGLHVRVSDDGGSRLLGEEARGVLFQVVRELLINCVKHAKTPEAWVSIRTGSDTLQLEVADDGKGFHAVDSPTTCGVGGGFGLFNVRQRIGHLGGELRIESGIGRGTVVRLSVPLTMEADPAVRGAA